MTSATEAIVEARGVRRTYPGPPEVVAVREMSMRVDVGEIVAIVGPSGSGKSTILNLLGLLDLPTEGELRLLGQNVAHLSRQDHVHALRSTIGFVFQDAFLLKDRTVRENIELRLAIAGVARNSRDELISSSLERVNMLHRIDSLAGNLSGGEAQRAAVARAITTTPKLLLADEPTGNLDSASTENVIDLLREATAGGQCAVVCVTHDDNVAQAADRSIIVRDGELVG